MLFNLLFRSKSSSYYSFYSTLPCPHCSNLQSCPLFPSISCYKCKLPLPTIDQRSYYDLFIPNINIHKTASPFWDLDLKSLKARFLTLQRQVHPDQYKINQHCHQYAMDQSSFVNKAYYTLQNDYTRAKYLMSQIQHLEYIEKDDHSSSSNNIHNKIPSDPMFLMKVLEYQEEIQNITNAADLDHYCNTVIKNDMDFKTIHQDLSDLFSKLPNPYNTNHPYTSSIDEIIELVQQKMIQFNYLQSIYNHIDQQINKIN